MKLLKLREVQQLTALSRSALYELMAADLFPRPIRVGVRSVRWYEHEVHEYIASRPRAGSDRPGR